MGELVRALRSARSDRGASYPARSARLDPETAEQLDRYLESRPARPRAADEAGRAPGSSRSAPRSAREQRMRRSARRASHLSEDEIRRMKEAVTKLAQRFGERDRDSSASAPSAEFRVKDTLRKELQYGGVPFRIQFDDKKKDKPQNVILCDVSGFRAQRLAIHAAVRLQPAGPLFASAELPSSSPRRRDHPTLRRQRHSRSDPSLALRATSSTCSRHSDFGAPSRCFIVTT